MSGDFLPRGSSSAPEARSFLRADDAEHLSADTIFELLADRRRRNTLYCLVDADGPVAFDTLVERVVERETAGLTPPRGLEKRVAAALHHAHLPRLATEGVVDYDADHGTVRYRGSAELERHLEFARDR